MSDVGKRLKSRIATWHLNSDKARVSMRLGDIREAAERIEELEVAMCDIADDCEHDGHPYLVRVAELIRSALDQIDPANSANNGPETAL